MFTIVRIAFWVIVFVVGFLLVEKFPRISKRHRRIILAAGIVLALLSPLVSVENAFVTFSSPESAFRYIHMDNVKLVVKGTDTALVIGEDKDGDVYEIIPKSDTGWNLAMAFDTKLMINKLISEEVVFQVCQYKNSGEYYITVFNPDGAAADVTDSRNSKFYHLDKSNNGDDETFYTYYAYVHDLDDEYTLTVNGKTYSVMDEES